MKDYEFKKKESTAEEIMKEMFNLSKQRIGGFFKKTLNNMLLFWLRLDRDAFLAKVENNINNN